MKDMKLSSMRLPKMSKKEMGEKMTVGIPGDRDEFPYGLRLNLNEDQIKKLDGLFEADVEGEVMIHAKAKIIDKRSHDMKGGKTERNIELQITDLACKPMMKEGGEENSDSAWYDNMKGKK